MDTTTLLTIMENGETTYEGMESAVGFAENFSAMWHYNPGDIARFSSKHGDEIDCVARYDGDFRWEIIASRDASVLRCTVVAFFKKGKVGV